MVPGPRAAHLFTAMEVFLNEHGPELGVPEFIGRCIAKRFCFHSQTNLCTTFHSPAYLNTTKTHSVPTEMCTALTQASHMHTVKPDLNTTAMTAAIPPAQILLKHQVTSASLPAPGKSLQQDRRDTPGAARSLGRYRAAAARADIQQQRQPQIRLFAFPISIYLHTERDAAQEAPA